MSAIMQMDPVDEGTGFLQMDFFRRRKEPKSANNDAGTIVEMVPALYQNHDREFYAIRGTPQAVKKTDGFVPAGEVFTMIPYISAGVPAGIFIDAASASQPVKQNSKGIRQRAILFVDLDTLANLNFKFQTF